MRIAKPPLSSRTTARSPGYDYTEPGAYFVTICAFKRWLLFGRVVEGKMLPSTLGHLVAELWQEIPRHHDSVILDASVVMPNHLHGIIVIRDRCRDPACRVPAEGVRSEAFGRPVAASLPTIIRSFKAAVRREAARRLHIAQPVWQPRYYEDVIRDDEDFDRVRDYIEANPLRWESDHENPNSKP